MPTRIELLRRVVDADAALLAMIDAPDAIYDAALQRFVDAANAATAAQAIPLAPANDLARLLVEIHDGARDGRTLEEVARDWGVAPEREAVH